jgi:hypothetical protein
LKLYDKKTGTETDFAGFPKGKYKVIVTTKVKETPCSTPRDATVEATLEITGCEGEGGCECTLGMRGEAVFGTRRIRVGSARQSIFVGA